MGRMSLNSKDSCFSANLTVVAVAVVLGFLAESESVVCFGDCSPSSSSSSSRLSIAGREGSEGTASSSAASILRHTLEGVSSGISPVERSEFQPASSHAVLGSNHLNFSGISSFLLLFSLFKLISLLDCRHAVSALFDPLYFAPSCPFVCFVFQTAPRLRWWTSQRQSHHVMARARWPISVARRSIHRWHLQPWSPNSNLHNSQIARDTRSQSSMDHSLHVDPRRFCRVSILQWLRRGLAWLALVDESSSIFPTVFIIYIPLFENPVSYSTSP